MRLGLQLDFLKLGDKSLGLGIELGLGKVLGYLKSGDYYCLFWRARCNCNGAVTFCPVYNKIFVSH